MGFWGYIEILLVVLILYNILRICVKETKKSNPDVHYFGKNGLESTVANKLRSVFPNLNDLMVTYVHRQNTNGCYLAFTNYGFILASLNAEARDAITDAWLIPYEKITGYQFFADPNNSYWEEMHINYVTDNGETDYLYFRLGKVIKSSMIDCLEVNMRRVQGGEA